ncbi:MAG TPA: NTP transferase domain-containing protein [Candidatus Eisenbacteria bacterium]|nr:NTP transferase domain-containing protein [Candidatus Eisenbacteria bacterium]
MMTGVVLAAGASARMGSPKALAREGRESFLTHGIRTLWSACDDVVVVLGAGAKAIQQRTEQEFTRLVQRGRLAAEFARVRDNVPDQLEVHFVTHPTWKRGMFSSVRAGLEAALGRKPEAILVMPVDHPSVRPNTVVALATAMHQALEAARSPRVRRAFSYALVPRMGGRRGHPVALSAALARAITQDAQAENLSDAVKRNARLVGYLDVRDRGVLRNVNRPGQ